jgi:hypothetical protein
MLDDHDHQMHDVNSNSSNVVVSLMDGNELASLLASMSMDYNEMESRRQKTEQELALTTVQLTSTTVQLTSTKEQLASATAAMSKLCDELNIANRTINDLEGRNDEMVTKLNEAKDSMAENNRMRDNERNNFETSLSNANRMIVEMETKLNKAQDNIWSLEAENDRLRDNIRRNRDTLEDMKLTIIQQTLSFQEGDEESDDESDEESDEESVGHGVDVRMSVNKRSLVSGATSSSTTQSSKRARASSTGPSTATSSTAALSLSVSTIRNDAAAAAIASMSFLHDPKNPQESWTISELKQPEVQQLIKEQQTLFMYVQFKLIESPTDRMLSRHGRNLFNIFLSNGGGVLRRLCFYASHSKFQRYITFDVLGGFMFPKGKGMKLMMKILGFKSIPELISYLTKNEFKAHPLNLVAGTRQDRCNHVNRFIHEDVKMNVDLSGIFDRNQQGAMKVAVVVGDPLVDLKDYIEGHLSIDGRKATKEDRERIFTNIYQKLKGVNDEDTRRILFTFDLHGVGKLYRNILPLSGRTHEESVRKKEDMISALVTATATQ